MDRPRICFGLFAAVMALVVILVNLAVADDRLFEQDLPDYGTWTGIVPLER